jgi:hypothetical protein
MPEQKLVELRHQDAKREEPGEQIDPAETFDETRRTSLRLGLDLPQAQNIRILA